MLSKIRLFGIALAVGIGVSVLAGQKAKAEDWGRYYHWPYSDFSQYQWSPYDQQKVYDGGYRYPKEMRVYPTKAGYRDWSTARKPYYRGYHFILDRF